jgi:hypothetical protein
MVERHGARASVSADRVPSISSPTPTQTQTR